MVKRTAYFGGIFNDLEEKMCFWPSCDIYNLLKHDSNKYNKTNILFFMN